MTRSISTFQSPPANKVELTGGGHQPEPLSSTVAGEAGRQLSLANHEFRT
eukprot:m.30975 g.30975  ORF g.30975 m.30975 type:complete len:50 (-) comp41490_c0_seq3:78-227(-)